MDKYTIPSLPTTQLVLEDLSDPDITQIIEPLKWSAEDELLRTAYTCFHNFKQLEKDLQTQTELNTNLDELNKKLVENIESMKKQA